MAALDCSERITCSSAADAALTERAKKLGIAIAAAWVFVVHMMTDREPFLETALFQDRNFVATAQLLLRHDARLDPALAHDHRRVNAAQDCEINDDLLSDALITYSIRLQ